MILGLKTIYMNINYSDESTEERVDTPKGSTHRGIGTVQIENHLQEYKLQ